MRVELPLINAEGGVVGVGGVGSGEGDIGSGGDDVRVGWVVRGGAVDRVLGPLGVR